MPNNLYITEEEGQNLGVNYDYVQSWHHPFSLNRTRNEPLTIRAYLEMPEARQKLILEILILLSRFWFATTEQLQLLLRTKDLPCEDLPALLEDCAASRILNVFALAVHPLDHIPEDAMKIWCMDYGARHILVHFYREDFVYWQSSDNQRSAEQVIKCLSTLRFFLNLLQVRRETLRVFEPIFDVTIGRRNIRFSACFEILHGASTRRFILESVRNYDLPTYWRKKVSEQISLFLEKKYWQRIMPDEPVFLLLAESPDAALEAADIFYRRTQSGKFRVTLDAEVAKGMENARFFKYVPQPEETGPGTLVPVRAALFSAKTLPGFSAGDPSPAPDDAPDSIFQSGD